MNNKNLGAYGGAEAAARRAEAGNDIRSTALKMIASAARTYPARPERAALRCALGDAAHLCDAIARGVLKENLSKRGAGTAHGIALAAIAERCGNAIWAMRELVTIPHTEPVSSEAHFAERGRRAADEQENNGGVTPND